MADELTKSEAPEQAQTGASQAAQGGTAVEVVPLSPLLEAIGRPIPGDNPCGKDVSYEEDFLAIKAEIDKMGAVSARVDHEGVAELRKMMDATRAAIKKTDRAEAEKQLEQRTSVVEQSGGPDFQLIADRATSILSETSKDLRVASYLCFALWHRDRVAGLAEGLAALDILVGRFWDGLYPAKSRLAARKSSVDFLTSKLSESVEDAQVKVDDGPPLERAKKVLAELQKHFTEKMPDSPPSLMGLSQAVEKCLKRVPKPVPAKPVAAESVAGPGGQAAAASAGAPLPGGELRTAQDAADQVKKVARFLREQNRKNPTPYRLVRSLRWDPLVALPPNDGGKTKFEVPALQRRTYLEGLRGAGDWEKLLDECETSFGQPGFHLWLDMQRLTSGALDALGGEFLQVRAAVMAELAILVQRVPKLTTLMFSDGTRFADAATVDWIEEAVMRVPGAAESARPAATSGDSELDAQFAAAKKALDGGDLAGAIALLQTGSRNDSSRKSAFRRKLAMAALCMRGNQASIARPLLEDLHEEIDRFSVDQWEPPLALDVWTNLHKCYELLASGPPTPPKQAMQQLGEKVFERICRLDVGYALASTGTKPRAKQVTAVPKSEPKQNNGENVVEKPASESKA